MSYWYNIQAHTFIIRATFFLEHRNKCRLQNRYCKLPVPSLKFRTQYLLQLLPKSWGCFHPYSLWCWSTWLKQWCKIKQPERSRLSLWCRLPDSFLFHQTKDIFLMPCKGSQALPYSMLLNSPLLPMKQLFGRWPQISSPCEDPNSRKIYGSSYCTRWKATPKYLEFMKCNSFFTLLLPAICMLYF